jgi:hypothetical protein
VLNKYKLHKYLMATTLLFYYCSLYAYNYYCMHSLKNTIGKESENDEFSINRGNASKFFNKSKNGSMWALDP